MQNNEDLDSVDLGLLKSIIYDDYEGVRLAIMAGADIFLAIQDKELLAYAVIESDFYDYIQEVLVYVLHYENEYNYTEFDLSDNNFVQNQQDDSFLMETICIGECK